MAKLNALFSRLLGEIRKNGVSNTVLKVVERKVKDRRWKNYDSMRAAARPSAEELRRQHKRIFIPEMLFSIVVPTYRTPEIFLRQMIESVLGQTFCHVELCIADGSGEDDSVERIVREYMEKDPRIKYKKLAENKGISENTNEALKMAEGPYVGLLDHDDLLDPDALYEVRRAVAMSESADVIYTDEDKVTMELDHYFDPHIKPDFNLELLRSNNYICHFLVIKRELLEKIGGFRSDYDGAQDYDLCLRLAEEAGEIVHVPKVLYHWRTHAESTAANPFSKLYAYESGKRALEDHLNRCGLEGQVSHTRFFGFYSTAYRIPGNRKAAVLFLSCHGTNHKKILKKYLGEIDGQTAGNVIYYDNEFNKFVTFSRNDIENLDCQVCVFVDSRVRKLSDGAICQLAAHAAREGTAVAGGVIYDRWKRIRKGRMRADENGHLHCMDAGLPAGFTGDFHGAVLQQETDGVTDELFAVKKEVLLAWMQEKGTEDEKAIEHLCRAVRESGGRIVYVPQASATLKSERED